MSVNSHLWLRRSSALLVSFFALSVNALHVLRRMFAGSYAATLEDINGVIAHLDVITR